MIPVVFVSHYSNHVMTNDKFENSLSRVGQQHCSVCKVPLKEALLLQHNYDFNNLTNVSHWALIISSCLCLILMEAFPADFEKVDCRIN